MKKGKWKIILCFVLVIFIALPVLLVVRTNMNSTTTLEPDPDTDKVINIGDGTTSDSNTSDSDTSDSDTSDSDTSSNTIEPEDEGFEKIYSFEVIQLLENDGSPIYGVGNWLDEMNSGYGMDFTWAGYYWVQVSDEANGLVEITSRDSVNEYSKMVYVDEENGIYIFEVPYYVSSGSSCGFSMTDSYDYKSECTAVTVYFSLELPEKFLTVEGDSSVEGDPSVETKYVSGVWVFNDKIELALTHDTDFEVNFICDNKNYSAIRIEKHVDIELDNLLFLYLGETGSYISDQVYIDGYFNSESYKTVDFGDTAQEVSDEFYTWLTANAVKQ